MINPRNNKMRKDGIVLEFVEIVKILHNVRANKDRRHKVDRYIVSYRGSDDNEYRKAFEFPVNTLSYNVNIPFYTDNFIKIPLAIKDTYRSKLK